MESRAAARLPQPQGSEHLSERRARAALETWARNGEECLYLRGWLRVRLGRIFLYRSSELNAMSAVNRAKELFARKER